MLELRNIVKDYVSSTNVTHALKGISIAFRKSEFVAILGPSGCGKTTTLNIIGGLDKYTSGDLLIDGRTTRDYNDRDWDTYRNHSIGFVFQTYNLIPHLNLVGNVELALTIGGVEKHESERRALEALEKVGLLNEAYKRPNQLSGGQMQRVAIARALVNDPEILLADEPTGALDSVTSIQVMDLLKEVAKDRLVIMVTHNPELAEKYANRIISMKDGEIVNDTNPFYVEPVEENKEVEKADFGRKSKMNFATTFLLSARNLWAKSKRTALVCVAGSIGIIGVSCVLAVTTGVKSYIHNLQDDMLSGNPVTIEESSMDLSTLMNMASTTEKKDALKKSIEDGKININYMIEYLADTRNKFESSLTKNNITDEYIQYVSEMPKEYYSASKRAYGIEHKYNLFTDAKLITGEHGEETNVEQVSLKAIEDIYVEMVKTTKFATYASMIPQFTNIFDVMPSEESYIANQYDILNAGGYLPKADNEMMIVVSNKQELTDLFLAQVGYYSEKEFASVIEKFVVNGETGYEGLTPSSFDYSTLLNKKFYLYPNDSIFTTETDTCEDFKKLYDLYNLTHKDKQVPFNPMQYMNIPDNPDKTGRKEMKITAIARAKSSMNYGSLQTGFVLSKAFDEKLLEDNLNSHINQYLRDELSDHYFTKHATETDAAFKVRTDGYISNLKDFENWVADQDDVKDTDFGKALKQTLYSSTIVALAGYSKSFDSYTPAFDKENPGKYTKLPGFGTTVSVGTIAAGSSSIISALLKNIDIPSQLTSAYRSTAGHLSANKICIYPLNFDEKHLVTDYLDKWNGNDVIEIHFLDGEGKVITRQIQPADRGTVKYTDNLEVVIKLINTLIDIISLSLIAFTSLSLVVSTVMIGIITYVSVVERVKEIGIIRSLGGRKFDVSNLFNVETFIIGGIAGAFGIAVTYLFSFIINLVIKGFASNVGAIVTLPWYLALAVLALSILLTLISGLIPARVAAQKDPVVALRSGE